jgi:hypothetical protein
MSSKKRFVRSITLMLVFLIVLSACARAASSNASPTVTVSGNTCTYEGPTQIPSKATLIFDIQDNGNDVYYNFLGVALSESQTVDDLRALTNLPRTYQDIPEELNHLFYYDVYAGDQKTKQMDFSANAAFGGEPIYIVCGNDLTNIGVVGPLEVKD